MEGSCSAGAIEPYSEMRGKKERGPGQREREKSSCNKTSCDSLVNNITKPAMEEEEEEAKDGFVIPELDIGTQRKHLARRNTASVMTVSGNDNEDRPINPAMQIMLIMKVV